MTYTINDINTKTTQISYLKLDIKRLNKATENLRLIESQVSNVEEPLVDKGLLIDGQMPFQFYIDEIKENISACLTNINAEIITINNKINRLEKEISLAREEMAAAESSEETGL